MDINNDTREHAAIHYANRKTKQQSHKGDPRPQEPKMPIRILSTYSPHNCHAAEDIDQNREDVNEILIKTCKRRRVIWCADANGKLGRESGDAEKNASNNAKSNIA